VVEFRTRCTNSEGTTLSAVQSVTLV
jgi:hypothetical protein